MSLSTVKPLDQTRWHNPANLDLTLVGPNHRLLSTDDLDKPLPEGAEYWDDDHHKWMKRGTIPHLPAKDLTYRIPLKPSDRLRQERDRLDELIGIVEAVEQGKEWEVYQSERLGWEEPEMSLDWFLSPERAINWKIRLKPSPPPPPSIPWTLETHPDVVCVMRKRFADSHHSISQWRKECAHVDGYGSITYAELHSDWLQRNGDPCGTEVHP